MALITRWFSTVAAGLGDGTSWANRAALLDGLGNWTTIITGWAFNTDALLALVGPGTYPCMQALVIGLFATPPAVVRPMFMHGCDSSGVAIEPDQTWQATAPRFDDSSFPVIAPPSGGGSMNINGIYYRCVKWLLAYTGGPGSNVDFYTDFCVLHSTFSDVNAFCAFANQLRPTNSWFECSGGQYLIIATTAGSHGNNTRFQGNPAATAGDRHGLRTTSTVPNIFLHRCVLAGHQGAGLISTVGGAGQNIELRNVTIVENGHGIMHNVIPMTSGCWHLGRCQITGNLGYGVHYQPDANLHTDKCRFRDNSLGDIRSVRSPNWGTNELTDAADGDEYVDVAAGDFTIKHTAAVWGQHYGAHEASVPVMLLKIHDALHILWSDDAVLTREATVWTLKP